MHLDSSANLLDFLRQAKQCKGAVLLKTPRGDSLNLHSEFCRLIVMMTKRTILSDAEIWCENEDDLQTLQQYLTN